MAPRLEIVNSKIPQSGISQLRALKYGKELEAYIAPRLSFAFSGWLFDLARNVQRDWPRKTGRSYNEIGLSARVSGYAKLDSIRGYFLVSSAVAFNEYGTRDRSPVSAQKIAIPILDGLFPDGAPKRLGPNSWRSLGTFIFHSKKTGNDYIAYKTQQGLKIIYLLVDKTKGLRELRKFRNMYDAKLPELYKAIEVIVQDAIVDVYITQFKEAADSIGADLILRKPPTVIPDATTHAGNLVPKY